MRSSASCAPYCSDWPRSAVGPLRMVVMPMRTGSAAWEPAGAAVAPSRARNNVAARVMTVPDEVAMRAVAERGAHEHPRWCVGTACCGPTGAASGEARGARFAEGDPAEKAALRFDNGHRTGLHEGICAYRYRYIIAFGCTDRQVHVWNLMR